MAELQDCTSNMKVDVRSVFDAVETLVRKFCNCIHVHQFILPKSIKIVDLVIFITVRQAKSVALRRIR